VFNLHSTDVQNVFEEVLASKKPSKITAYPLVFDDQPENGTTYWDWLVDPILSREIEVEALLLTEYEVTERVLGQQAFDKSQELLSAIRRAQKQANLYLEPLAFFDALVSDVVSLTDSEYGFIGEVLYKDDGQPYIKLYAIPNFPMNEETRVFLDAHAPQGLEFTNLDTLLGAAVRTGEVVIANNPAGDSRSGGLPKGHPPLNAFLGIPIKVRGKLVATLGLANRLNGYSESVVEFIQPLLNMYIQLIGAYSVSLEKREAVISLRESENYVHRLAIPSVEYEHQELIKLINDCYAQMDSETGPETIERLLNEIYAAVAEHFAHEQELMHKAAYPECEAHTTSHEKLLLVFRDHINRYVENPDSGVQLLQKMLADWFARHVSTDDQKLHEHFLD